MLSIVLFFFMLRYMMCITVRMNPNETFSFECLAYCDGPFVFAV